MNPNHVIPGLLTGALIAALCDAAWTWHTRRALPGYLDDALDAVRVRVQRVRQCGCVVFFGNERCELRGLLAVFVLAIVALSQRFKKDGAR